MAGLDFSVVVYMVGSDVTAFKIGDPVFGNAPGSLAQFCVAEESKIALKPDNLSHAEAAAMPTAYLTGLQGTPAGPKWCMVRAG